jgi:hypothetical protein
MNSDDFLQVVEIDQTLMDVLLQDGNGKNVKCRLAVAVDPESRTVAGSPAEAGYSLSWSRERLLALERPHKS